MIRVDLRNFKISFLLKLLINFTKVHYKIWKKDFKKIKEVSSLLVSRRQPYSINNSPGNRNK